VFGLILLTDVLRATFQIRRDDVPAGAALGQVIQGRQASGERIRMFKRQRGGQAKAQMLGHQGHGRNQLQRIVDRHLRSLTDRRVTVAVVDVINAQHIGNEQAVELAALKDFRQVGPVFEVLVLPGTITWMRPQARRLMADAVHVEGVQANFAGST
jgi:hypothetical protein